MVVQVVGDGAAGTGGDAVALPGITRDPGKVRSGRYLVDPLHAKITWSVSHLGFSTYAGQFSDVAATFDLDAGNPAASRLVAEVRMASVASLNSVLDHHLQTAEFFDTENHPAARFEAGEIHPTGAAGAEIGGLLTLRGVTRPFVMMAEFNQAGPNPLSRQYTVGFDGRAVIRRSEFGISYGLPLLGDEVTLHIEAEFVLEARAGGA